MGAAVIFKKAKSKVLVIPNGCVTFPMFLATVAKNSKQDVKNTGNV